MPVPTLTPAQLATLTQQSAAQAYEPTESAMAAGVAQLRVGEIIHTERERERREFVLGFVERRGWCFVPACSLGGNDGFTAARPPVDAEPLRETSTRPLSPIEGGRLEGPQLPPVSSAGSDERLKARGREGRGGEGRGGEEMG